jgi:hypothetical protein
MILCFSILSNGGFMINNNTSITHFFHEVVSITITKNGEKFSFLKGDDKFETIISALESTTTSSHEMPAYGVSLDGETKSRMQSGTWLELEFKIPKTHNDLPFEALLIEINEDYQGFNLIRKNNNKYDGRCFYLNLENNMKTLSNEINNVLK